MRALFAWVFDWRNIATLAAAALVAVILWRSEVDVQASTSSRAAMVSHVRELEGEVANLTTQVSAAQYNEQRLAQELSVAEDNQTEANAKIDALIAQVRRLGARPVVVVSPATTTQPAAPQLPPTTLPPAPPPSTIPPTTTTTAKPKVTTTTIKGK